MKNEELYIFIPKQMLKKQRYMKTILSLKIMIQTRRSKSKQMI